MIPYLLAVVGGYLIGDSLKDGEAISEKMVDGGKLKGNVPLPKGSSVFVSGDDLDILRTDNIPYDAPNPDDNPSDFPIDLPPTKDPIDLPPIKDPIDFPIDFPPPPPPNDCNYKVGDKVKIKGTNQIGRVTKVYEDCSYEVEPISKMKAGGEVYKLGDTWSAIFDYDGMLKTSLKAKTSWGVKKLEKLSDSLEDVNYHTANRPLGEVIEALKNDMPNVAEIKMEEFHEAIRKEMSDEMADGGMMADGGEIASTIVEQLGGTRRLNVMIGAYNFYDLGNGLSFKLKNAKANYVKIKLNGKDLYDVEVGRIRGTTYKIVKQQDDLYADQLKGFIEKATGMYLSLENGGEIKWQDVEVGDNARVKSENKMGLIVKTYGRKFHLKFVDGSEKTYDAIDLEFFKETKEEDMGVQFIDYKGETIMYEPHNDEYFTNDIQFNTIDEAKRYIDEGSKPPSWQKSIYGKGLMGMGGETFDDKVKAISKKLKGTKVPKRLQKDYGKTYDTKEAEEAGKRIVGSMRKKYEM
jgi:hypothetical protein